MSSSYHLHMVRYYVPFFSIRQISVLILATSVNLCTCQWQPLYLPVATSVLASGNLCTCQWQVEQEEVNNTNQTKRIEQNELNNSPPARPCCFERLCYLAFLLSALKTITKINVISLSYIHEQKKLIALQEL